MNKFCSFLVLFCFVVLFNCNGEDSKSTVQEVENETKIKFSAEEIEKLNYSEFILDRKAKATINQWPKYTELVEVIENLKNGNVTFFIDNKEIVELLFNDLRSSLPEKIKTDAIFARLKVLETAGYKLEDNLAYTELDRENILVSLKEFLVSFSNLNLQINKKFERDSQQIEKPQ